MSAQTQAASCRDYLSRSMEGAELSLQQSLLYGKIGLLAVEYTADYLLKKLAFLDLFLHLLTQNLSLLIST